MRVNFCCRWRADAGVGLDQVARAGQQIREVEGAGRLLQLLVALGRAGQLLLQARGEIGVGVLPELLEIVEQRVARGQHVGAGRVLAELVAAALPRAREAAVARQIDEPRFPAVEIALAERLLELNLPAEAAHRVGVDVQVVARRQGRRGEGGELMQRRDEPIDLRAAVERRPIPGVREVARLGQRPAGAAQAIDRPAAVAAAAERRRARPAQRAAQSFGRVLQRLLQPRAERAAVDAVRLRLGEDGEQRIDARFDRPLAQQLGAEAVDGVDVRFLERLERLFEPVADRGSVAFARARSSSSRSRSFSSPAAFSVNVTATISTIVARPVASTRRMRFTSSVVLPVPAAASTISVSSRSLAIAARASASPRCLGP